MKMYQKTFKVLAWLSLGSGLFFFAFFSNEKTMYSLTISVLIATMYSFIMGLGNGFFNDYLNKRYSWVDKTRIRTILGVIGTIVVNCIALHLLLSLTYTVTSPLVMFSKTFVVCQL